MTAAPAPGRAPRRCRSPRRCSSAGSRPPDVLPSSRASSPPEPSTETRARAVEFARSRRAASSPRAAARVDVSALRQVLDRAVAAATPEEDREAMATLDDAPQLGAVREKVRGRRAPRLRRRRHASRERRPARPGRARRRGPAPARWHRRGLLRQQPVPEPHERLPGEVQVLRLRAHGQAGRRLPVGDRRRSCSTRSRRYEAQPLHRDPHGRRRAPAPRLRRTTSISCAACTRRCRTCT